MSILVGLASAKVWAMLLGPSGLGFMGLLQSLLGLAGLTAAAGLGTGLVRLGANALERGDREQVAALRRAAWLLFWVVGSLAVAIMVSFRTPIGEWMLGGAEQAGSAVLMALALVFNLAAGVQVSILITHHRIGAQAKVGVLTSLLGTGASLALVWLWGAPALAPAIVAGAVVGWLISATFLRRETEALPCPTHGMVVEGVWSLLRFGGPYTASMLVGTGVQFALPALVLHTLGIESVGYSRAAFAISGVYLGFLLTAMGQDYYPRISAVSDRPAELVRLVNQQHWLTMLLAGPMILGALALAPYLVPIIYTQQFSPAIEVLEWQLVSDLFKFTSWTMGFVILARGSSKRIFIVELLAGINMILFSYLGIKYYGLAGIGLGFLGTYVIHYFVVFLIVCGDIGVRLSTNNIAYLMFLVLGALWIRALPAVGHEQLRTPVALFLALCASVVSACVIWREVTREPTGLPARFGARLGKA